MLYKFLPNFFAISKKKKKKIDFFVKPMCFQNMNHFCSLKIEIHFENKTFVCVF